VIVTSEAAPINTTNAEVIGSLNTREIMDKPTFNQGSFLNPGRNVSRLSGESHLRAEQSHGLFWVVCQFQWHRTRGATFQINGVNNDDSSENQNRQGASLATIKEFQVITNNFTAEFGRVMAPWCWFRPSQELTIFTAMLLVP